MGTYAIHQTLKCIREVQIHNHPSIAFEAQRDVVTHHLVHPTPQKEALSSLLKKRCAKKNASFGSEERVSILLSM